MKVDGGVVHPGHHQFRRGARHGRHAGHRLGGVRRRVPDLRPGRGARHHLGELARPEPARQDRWPSASSSSRWWPGCGPAACSIGLGGLLALVPGSRRRATDPVSAPSAMVTGNGSGARTGIGARTETENQVAGATPTSSRRGSHPGRQRRGGRKWRPLSVTARGKRRHTTRWVAGLRSRRPGHHRRGARHPHPPGGHRGGESPGGAHGPAVLRRQHPAPGAAPVSLRSLRGHYVFVNFFASWCGPCQQEAPDLITFFYQNAPKEEADLVSVVFHDQVASAESFLKTQGAPWPAVDDPGGTIAAALRRDRPPTTFLIDPSGRITVEPEIGPATEAELQKMIDQARKLARRSAGPRCLTRVRAHPLRRSCGCGSATPRRAVAVALGHRERRAVGEAADAGAACRRALRRSSAVPRASTSRWRSPRRRPRWRCVTRSSARWRRGGPPARSSRPWSPSTARPSCWSRPTRVDSPSSGSCRSCWRPAHWSWWACCSGAAPVCSRPRAPPRRRSARRTHGVPADTRP